MKTDSKKKLKTLIKSVDNTVGIHYDVLCVKRPKTVSGKCLNFLPRKFLSDKQQECISMSKVTWGFFYWIK